MSAALFSLAQARREKRAAGIVSVCSAHPTVIAATCAHYRDSEGPVLIEATCNQVNQDGGYTGMNPAAFRAFVEGIAEQEGFDAGRLILGGDHLGPNPWRHLPVEAALAKAEAMVAAYVRAGFTKLHLDASMGCAGEPEALEDRETAARAARLARVAERAAKEAGVQPPVYIIGTEVPTPGGALHDLDGLVATSPAAALETIATHRAVFGTNGLADAFERVIGLVVQPGVEFGNADVIAYQPAKALALSAVLLETPQFVFEAHSTDYQPANALAALVRDGFAILKVGPWLTFALREALYGLDQIARALNPADSGESLPDVMECLMLREPESWRKHYHGDANGLRIQRHFSYSDRIRYYWPHPEAQAAVDRLSARLGGRTIPEPLISQYLGALYPAVMAGAVSATSKDLRIAAVRRVLKFYSDACERC
ncbi:MAG: D-tagatose-bisphosphate aldolase, class II, non-catalytic subunit [Rhizobiales bacterium]|nr:D-tagatose-bisphosphate aldolase, class II, non-catalytic subunit [Hyphomicrobiales bacterium]